MGILDKLRGLLTPPPPPVLDDGALGEIAAWCLTRDKKWINRRVERIELIDDETIRRQVSLDFRLPELADEDTTVYVPLAILRKGTLTNFNVWQEDGARMSVLNTARNGRISAAALKNLARRHAENYHVTLNEEKVFPLLERVAGKPAEEARIARNRLAKKHRALMHDGTVLKTTVDSLTDGFQLLVAVTLKPNTTRVIKFSYDEGIDWSGGDLASRAYRIVTRSLGEFIGWMPKRWDLALPGIDRGQGYHLEVVAPQELDIRSAVVKRLDAPGRRKLTLAEGGGKERVHLLPSRAHRLGRARLTVKLRPQRGGVMLAYVAISVLAAAELLLALPHVRSIEPQTGSAVLLLLPALIAAFLIRPGEHTYASRMLRGVRLLTVGAALAAIWAAGVLAIFGTAPKDEEAADTMTRLERVEHLWTMATWVACGCAGVLLAGYALSSRLPSALARWVRRRFRARPE